MLPPILSKVKGFFRKAPAPNFTVEREHLNIVLKPTVSKFNKLMSSWRFHGWKVPPEEYLKTPLDAILALDTLLRNKNMDDMPIDLSVEANEFLFACDKAAIKYEMTVKHYYPMKLELREMNKRISAKLTTIITKHMLRIDSLL